MLLNFGGGFAVALGFVCSDGGLLIVFGVDCVVWFGLMVWY